MKTQRWKLKWPGVFYLHIWYKPRDGGKLKLVQGYFNAEQEKKVKADLRAENGDRC